MCRNLDFCSLIGGLKIHFDIGTCLSLGVCHRALLKAVSQRYLGMLYTHTHTHRWTHVHDVTGEEMVG